MMKSELKILLLDTVLCFSVTNIVNTLLLDYSKE